MNSEQLEDAMEMMPSAATWKTEPIWRQPHKTYYFRGDLAYTEDHILIRELYIFNVAPSLTSKQLKSHFNAYGAIEYLHLDTQVIKNMFPRSANEKKRKTKTGHVMFVDARSAAKALSRKVHYLKKLRLCVVPSDSWRQPDAYGNSYEIPPEEKADRPMSILDLNDHCLDHIFRLLSLPDRLHFARTCLRFREIYRQAAPALDKSMKFEEFEQLTMWDARDFFELSGKHVMEMEGTIPNRHEKRLPEYLGAHCVNIRSLKISANKLPLAMMDKIFGQIPKLNHLQLRSCDLRNESLLALKHLPQLKSLDLTNNDRLTGQNMHRLPTTLESLTLSNCTGMQQFLLVKAVKALKHLKELHIKGIHTIGLVFKQLVESHHNNTLEVITVSNGFSHSLGHQYEHIAQLPRLKKVTVYTQRSNETLRPALFTMLVEHKSRQLEYFEAQGENCLNSTMIIKLSMLTALRTLVIPSNEAVGSREMEALCALQQLEEINLKNCANVDNNSVLTLVLSCPKLTVLHLDSCPLLTVKLLSDIVFKMRKQLQQKDFKRPLPIKLTLYDSNVHPMSLRSPDFAAKDIVDVVIKPTFLSGHQFLDLTELLVYDDDTYFGRDDLYDFEGDGLDFFEDDYDGALSGSDEFYCDDEIEMADVEEYWD